MRRGVGGKDGGRDRDRDRQTETARGGRGKRERDSRAAQEESDKLASAFLIR